MLDDFIKATDGVDADDDDDIYRQYQEMASRSHENEPADFSGFAPRADEMKPEVPRFEEYFQAEADGVHPFDKIAHSFDQSEVGTAEEAKVEEAREKRLYERELLGRLMGQKLTPGEYEIVAGRYADADLRQKRVLDSTNQEFLNARHTVRLIEEAAEQVRRRKVISKEWKESESRNDLQEWLNDMEDGIRNGPEKK